MRKIELFSLYRDLLRPDAVWEEQAAYGGYRWIDLFGDNQVWIDRSWEPYVLAFKQSEGCGKCLMPLKAQLTSGGLLDFSYKFEDTAWYLAVVNDSEAPNDILRPTKQMADNLARLHRLLASAGTFCVSGYSYELDKWLAKNNFSFITDSAGYLAASRVVTTDELISLSSRMILLSFDDNTALRPMIRNWSNIVILRRNVFCE